MIIMAGRKRTSPKEEPVVFDRNETPYYADGNSPDDRMPERENLNWGRFGRFNIDPAIQARFPNLVLAWIVYSHRNEEDRENYQDAVERKYMPVLKSEVPEYDQDAYLTPFDQSERGNDKLIRRGGQIMMKRLKTYHKAENDYWNNMHRQQQDINASCLMSGFKPNVAQQTRTAVRESSIFQR